MGATRCLAADRVSLDIEFCVKFFREHPVLTPEVIPDVASKVAAWPIYRVSGKMRGAGYFQLARVAAVREKGGLYCPEPTDHWCKTWSDGRFRRILGGIVPLNTLPQYHLNHSRIGPDEQR